MSNATSSMSYRADSGVTLLELLIAIILILLVLILGFNAMKSIHLQTKVTACVSNQRQIGIALLTYAAEHRGNFPGFVQGGVTLSSTGNQRTLAERLIPYIGDKSIFSCPGAEGHIYVTNTSGWYDWLHTAQNGRSGYWHIYMNPDSDLNAALVDKYGRNDRTNCDPRKVMMHCYYHGDLKQSSHPRGEVNVLRLDGRVETWIDGKFNRNKNYHANFEAF